VSSLYIEGGKKHNYTWMLNAIINIVSCIISN